MGIRASSAWNSFASSAFDYETQKVVQIHSVRIGATYRAIQLGIVLYIIVWVMYYEKGYQAFDEAVSGVTAKLKGVAHTSPNKNSTLNDHIGVMVWDAADYVVPPQQRSAFFVTTNLVMTPGQQLSVCEESHDVHGIDCTHKKVCSPGQVVAAGSGIQTGRCVPSTRRANLSVCEIYGWCPTEYDVLPDDFIIANAPNFTVMLKNSIEFVRYHVKRRNILSWMDKEFLYTCRYNPNHEKNKFCPIFRLGDIMEYTQAENKRIWNRGGMVSIHIEWNCNLDYDEEQCLPNYIFRRLDDFDSPVGNGWNFRYSHHYIEGNVRKRNLVKAYGIQFFITVYGRGGKFNMLTFSMNIGSGLALLGIATVLCDAIVLNITRKRVMYRNARVDLVTQRRRAINTARQKFKHLGIKGGSERLKQSNHVPSDENVLRDLPDRSDTTEDYTVTHQFPDL